jgi:hypothetical protein
MREAETTTCSIWPASEAVVLCAKAGAEMAASNATLELPSRIRLEILFMSGGPPQAYGVFL